ncbi:MAG: 16S rRNA (cytidine(1402)-2'-O)-methyltransferase [Thermotogota bacterium]|nr:16S rRNA (cytidine(1402)-2'-O)-methyltransferase [Thermotogota bacterium]
MIEKTTLYIVPTPIGNLQDITLRALEVLKQVDLIGAEDTRKSGKLLKHFSISTPMVSYHKFNEEGRADFFLEKLAEGKNIAIISDAGMPGISDPAEIIVQKAIDSGFKVECLPGATAFLPALIISGLSSKRFLFIGFLPNQKKEQEKLLNNLKSLENTLIFYEAPHRIFKFLQLLKNYFGNRKIAIARELTKMHETVSRGYLQDFLESSKQITVKGEFVIVMEGATEVKMTNSEIMESLKNQIKEGKTKKEAVLNVSKKNNVAKNRVYNLSLEL